VISTSGSSGMADQGMEMSAMRFLTNLNRALTEATEAQ